MPIPDTEPYPSEYPKIQHAFGELKKRFEHKRLDDNTIDQFHEAAINLFGEAGFRVGVTWDEAVVNGQGGTYIPTVVIVGRVEPESGIDHDRMQHDIVTGKADGRVGYLRQGTGGQLHEDPVKKLIT